MTVILERPAGLAADTLVPEDVRDRLARYIVREHPEFAVDFAGRLVLEAARFQAASAALPDVRMAPSALVDHGWHAWLMHTHDRDELMDRIGGVVHHVPDLPGEDNGDAKAIRRQTLQAMTDAGYAPDRELWPAASGDCTQCHAGCSDSPNSGKKK
ncbi:glycine-rich domain-containing protein [Streptomyces collinus]